jgi:uncharacterized membrane protein YeaQ/YmgE (transglycosylase-associated protein family)
MEWVWLIIVGIVVGILARAIHPGRDPMGFLVTALIGVASLLIAGAVFSAGWAKFVVGIVVAVVLVALYNRFIAGPEGGGPAHRPA